MTYVRVVVLLHTYRKLVVVQTCHACGPRQALILIPKAPDSFKPNQYVFLAHLLAIDAGKKPKPIWASKPICCLPARTILPCGPWTQAGGGVQSGRVGMARGRPGVGRVVDFAVPARRKMASKRVAEDGRGATRTNWPRGARAATRVGSAASACLRHRRREDQYSRRGAEQKTRGKEPNQTRVAAGGRFPLARPSTMPGFACT